MGGTIILQSSVSLFDVCVFMYVCMYVCETVLLYV